MGFVFYIENSHALYNDKFSNYIVVELMDWKVVVIVMALSTTSVIKTDLYITQNNFWIGKVN